MSWLSSVLEIVKGLFKRDKPSIDWDRVERNRDETDRQIEALRRKRKAIDQCGGD